MVHQLRSNTISCYILFAVVALAPLPFGSVQEITIAIWCVVLGLAAVAATPRSFQPAQLALLGCVGVLIAAYGILLHEQLSLHPWFATPDTIWRKASAALGTPLKSSVSLARNLPLFAIGAPLAAILSMICGFIICVDRQRAYQLLKVVAWSGAAYAIFAVVTFAVDPTHVLWRAKQAYQTVLTGTFINRNTAAVYFGMCSTIWLLLLAERARKYSLSTANGLASTLNLMISKGSSGTKIAFALLFLCLAAMFMTGSRAGIVLSLFAMVLAIVLRFYQNLTRRRGVLTAALGGVFISLLLLQLMGAGVNSHFDADGLSDEGRFETYRATWRMIANHPWFGTGLGTFAWGFPAYRSSAVSVWGVWDKAHNTLFEIAAEMGLPLASLVVAGWCIVLGFLVRGIVKRRRDRVIPVAAFSVAILSVLHSLIDFSLQIPGYAIVVFALAGAGLSQSFSSAGPQSIKAKYNPQTRRQFG